MNDELLDMMEKVITKDQNELIIYRVCSIIEKYSKRYPSLVVEYFPFINELLIHCDKRSVIDLFRKLSADIAFDREMTRFLQAINTPNFIISLINNSDHPEIENSLDIEKDKFVIAGLFILISILCENIFLRVRFQTDNALYALTKIFSQLIPEILDKQWKALIILFDDTTMPFFQDVIQLAIENINYRIEKYSEFQTLSIDFLTCFIESDNAFIQEFLDNNVLSFLFDAMSDFPYHTILHQSVIKFITTCLKTEFSNTVIDIVVPFACDVFLNTQYQILHATCLNLLYEIEKQKYGHDSIEKIIPKDNELWNLFSLIDQSKIPPKSSTASPIYLFNDKITPFSNPNRNIF